MRLNLYIILIFHTANLYGQDVKQHVSFFRMSLAKSISTNESVALINADSMLSAASKDSSRVLNNCRVSSQRAIDSLLKDKFNALPTNKFDILPLVSKPMQSDIKENADSLQMKLPTSLINNGNLLEKVPNINSPLAPKHLNFFNSDKINGLSNSIPSEVPTFRTLEEINSSELKIDCLTDEATIIKEQVANIRPEIGKLNLDDIEKFDLDPDALQTDVLKLDALNETQDQIAATDKIKRYHDPMVVKEEALNRAKLEATNHFAGHEEELKAAMEKLSAVKSKVSDTEGIVDLFEKRQKFPKDKSFVDRFVVGISFQVQKPHHIFIDINPNIGYKLSGRFTAGLGWNERIVYSTNSHSFINSNRIYGPRNFIHFKLKQNFSIKGEMELMNAVVPFPNTVVNSEINRDWVKSYFVGLKRDFKLSGKVLANAQVLYKLFSRDGLNPYTQKINVRMGFELINKVKKKREKLIKH